MSDDSSEKGEDCYTQSHEDFENDEIWNEYFDNEKENELYSTQSQNSFQVERASSHSKDSNSDDDSESSSSTSRTSSHSKDSSDSDSESGVSTPLSARKNVKRTRVAKSPPKNPSSDLNLRCHKSRLEHLNYPKCYKGLVTPYYYCTSSELFKKWKNMTRDEQKKNKTKFNSNDRAKLIAQIPGNRVEGCTCVGCAPKAARKQRSDKGVTRKRRSSTGCNTSGTNDNDVATYDSMAHPLEAREGHIRRNKLHNPNAARRKRGKRHCDVGDRPKNASQSFNSDSVEALMRTFVAFQQFLALSTPEQVENIPRVQAALAVNIQIGESQSGGGCRKSSSLRRDKDLTYRMSSNKGDFVDVLTIFGQDNWREGRDVIDFLGTDQKAMDAIINEQKKYRERRGRKTKTSKGTDDIINTGIDENMYSETNTRGETTATKRKRKRNDRRPLRGELVQQVNTLKNTVAELEKKNKESLHSNEISLSDRLLKAEQEILALKSLHAENLANDDMENQDSPITTA